MNTSEYRRKTHPELYRRSWPYTIVTAILFILVIGAMITSWRYLNHDLYMIGFVLVPTGLVAVMLLAAAVNGRKQVAKEAWAACLELIFWW